MVDRISVGEERFVIINEGKKGTTGEVLKQCLLSLKDARDQNSGGACSRTQTNYMLTNKVLTYSWSGYENGRWSVRVHYDGRVLENAHI